MHKTGLLDEAAAYINSAPTPEVRQARKMWLFKSIYGAGPHAFTQATFDLGKAIWPKPVVDGRTQP